MQYVCQYFLPTLSEAKPRSQSNVLIDESGHALLSDIGLDALLDEAFTQYMVHFRWTTLLNNGRWMAPEILTSTSSRAPYSVKSDVFSFAMFIVEVCQTFNHPKRHRIDNIQVLTLKQPFDHLTDVAAILDILDNHRPIQPLNSTLAALIWPILERCWVEDANDRPNATAVITAIKQLVPSNS